MDLPSEVRQAALAALSTRRHDTSVLPLVHDSLLDGPVAGRQPGRASDRTLVFRGDGLVVTIDLSYTPEGRTAVTSIEPRGSYGLECTTPGASVALLADSSVPLALARSVTGPCSFLITRRDGQRRHRSQTAWVVL